MNTVTLGTAAAATGYVILGRWPETRRAITLTAIVAALSQHPVLIAASIILFAPAAIAEHHTPRTRTRTRTRTRRNGNRRRVPRRLRDPLRQATPAMRAYCLDRDGHACVYCGRGGPTVKIHMDHIVPWSQGGPTHPRNLQSLCQRCNLRKSVRSDREQRLRYTAATGFAPTRRPLHQRR